MKTRKLLLTALCLAGATACFLGFSASSCNNESNGEHEHTYAEEWIYNQENPDFGHWHACTYEGCVQISGLTAHTFNSGKVLTAATCETAGSAEYECTACHYKKTETVSATGHKWGEWTVTEANKPTATSKGKATRTCGNANCGAAASEKEYELPALSDTSYTKTNDTATCSAAGSITYTYNNTGNSVSVSFTVATPVNANAHNYGPIYDYTDGTGHWQVCANNSAHTTEKVDHDCTVVTTEATCTTAKTVVSTCKDCEYSNTETQGVALGHAWGAGWTVTEANKPTATSTGKATRTCSNAGCNASASEKEYELPALTSTDYTLSNNTATCIAAGTATYSYSKGGVSVSFTAATPVKADAHNYGDTYVNTDPEGHYYVCSNNQEHLSEKEDHNENGTNGACTVCGYSATGHSHNWGTGWTVEDENKPTATKAGKATRTCSNEDCDAELSDKEYELPVLTSTDYSKTDDTATCMQTGSITYTYSNTEDGINVSFTVETPVNPTAHNYGENYTYTDGTGHYKVCANNSEHTTEKVEHDCDVVTNEATCTTAKTIVSTCKDCEYSNTETEGEALGHDWSAWSVTDENKPGETETGKATRTCGNANCDAELSEKEYTLPELTSADYEKTDDTADCTTAGSITYTYSNTDDDVTVSFDIATPAKGHAEELEYRSSTATCTEAGDAEYWYCPDCGQKYSDANGKTEIDVPDAMPATGHAEELEYSPSTATCTEAGEAEYWYCPDCGQKYSDEGGENEIDAPEAMSATGHTEEDLEAKAATCTEDGHTAGKKCSVCNEIIAQVIPARHNLSATTTAPTVRDDNTVSQKCATCNKTVVYSYGAVVTNAVATLINNGDTLSSEVNYKVYYIKQTVKNPYLQYVIPATGTYEFYWAGLNRTFNIATATFGNSTAAFINGSGNVTPANIPDGFVFEGYYTGTSGYTYNVTDAAGNVVTDADGKNVTKIASTGDFVTLTKNSFVQYTVNGFDIVKLTFNATEGKTFKFRNVASDASELSPAYSLIGINEKPSITAVVPSLSAGDYAMKETNFEFEPITEDAAGEYTFTAETGEFNLYVNGELYSDGEKSYFGYVGFRDRYLTVNLSEDDVVKVVKVSGKAFTVHKGALEEPAAPQYRKLTLDSNEISLLDTHITVSAYEDATEQFYAFTATESGYYVVSVEEGVSVHVDKRVDKTHYLTVLDVTNMGKRYGGFKAEAGETVILAFTSNNSTEFNVKIALDKEPEITLKANEKLEGIYFDGIETFIKIIVDESVAEGTYLLSFEVAQNFLDAYIYFSIGKEIKVDNVFDTNAVGMYVNADIAAGAHNTIGVCNREDPEEEHFKRNVTVKGGDIIYLATTALTPGLVSVTLTPVAE